jgi:hypothetical protein
MHASLSSTASDKIDKEHNTSKELLHVTVIPIFHHLTCAQQKVCYVSEPQPLTRGRVGTEQSRIPLSTTAIYLYNSSGPYAHRRLYNYVSDFVQHIQPIQNWMSRNPIYKNHASPTGNFAVNRFPESQSASSGVSPSSTVIGKWLEHKMCAVMYSHLVNECWLHCDCCSTIGVAGLIMTSLFPST